jgi:hypothetical protein
MKTTRGPVTPSNPRENPSAKAKKAYSKPSENFAKLTRLTKNPFSAFTTRNHQHKGTVARQ